MATSPLNGLIAATYTPMNDEGELNLAGIPALVEHLIGAGICGVYVCGSTGEGMSLTTFERQQVTEAFVEAVARRIPVIVQVGHNCLEDARTLARHAMDCGADIVSATCPSYYPIADVKTLVATMARIAAAAPDIPFYYYHIPALTGSAIDIADFMVQARESIPTLSGLKYTDTRLFEYQDCRSRCGLDVDIVFGCDEMLLGALATGAMAAIGSTYNVIPQVYQTIMQSFSQGDLTGARAAQQRSVDFVNTMKRYPFHSAMKTALQWMGLPMGTCRLPQRPLSLSEAKQLRADLESLRLLDFPGE